MKQPLILMSLLLLMCGLVYVEMTAPYKSYTPFRLFSNNHTVDGEEDRVEQTYLETIREADEPGKTSLILFLTLQILAPLAYTWRCTTVKGPGWTFLFLAVVEAAMMLAVWFMMSFYLFQKNVVYEPGYYLILLGGGLACAMLAHVGWDIAGRSAWRGLVERVKG